MGFSLVSFELALCERSFGFDSVGRWYLVSGKKKNRDRELNCHSQVKPVPYRRTGY
jgi:hypothetical protein